jgi:hypothetical protein
MTSHLLADGVLLIHFAFILFAIGGGLAVLYRRWVVWLHLPAVLWASVVNLAGWECPLTPLENKFRVAAGLAGYPGGFVEHYVAPLIYPAGMTRPVALTAGVSILIWNAGVYGLVLWRLGHRRKINRRT